MASINGIRGNPISALRHNLRENKTYANKDINITKKSQNYTLSTHGNTSRECIQHYHQMIDHVYRRQGKTMTAAECVITAPLDLAPEQEKEFFEASYKFLNQILFDGKDERCILATVHKDEGGQPHLHYTFTFPEERNPSYITLEEKINSGIEQIEELFNITVSKEQRWQISDVIAVFENRTDEQRETETIQSFREILNLERDDARKAFIRCRRTEKQKYPTRLMPKDSFLNKSFFDEFHQKFQTWINDNDLNCSVYKGGGGISLTVNDLKMITAETGQILVKKEDLQHLKEQVHAYQKEKSMTKDNFNWGTSSWGKEKEWERKY